MKCKISSLRSTKSSPKNFVPCVIRCSSSSIEKLGNCTRWINLKPQMHDCPGTSLNNIIYIRLPTFPSRKNSCKSDTTTSSLTQNDHRQANDQLTNSSNPRFVSVCEYMVYTCQASIGPLRTTVYLFKNKHLQSQTPYSQGGRRFETLPRYEPLETKTRPIFQLKITRSACAAVLAQCTLMIRYVPRYPPPTKVSRAERLIRLPAPLASIVVVA